jgi:hypothetical protein
MLRFLALTAVLFIIPFAIHAAWILATQRRMPVQDDYPTMRVIAFSVVGAVLVLIGLVWLALSEGSIAGDGQPVAAIVGTMAG